ncbi:ABC transporter substrate-binding protein [Paenibacillus sp. B01]|uniref:ABC transporter substrate-binding protein n=1 Tax=Paenibacillus sp. B01 TaxID=2660554 RepID=UPI00129A75A6|nr:ABC transporter substrate-binding protein [Paenibacillus sp. B01]QGG54861.1 extracellular solute-binding protein [Paenibacillus sp. B01]
MNSRRRWAIALLLSLALAASACSGGNEGGQGTGDDGGGSGDGKGGKVTLSSWTLFSGGDGDNMQAMIDAFNSEHPDIKVENTVLEWGEYYTKLITAVGNGNGPDIGISHTSRLPDLINQGVVSSMDDAAEAAGIDWSTFNPNILGATVVDGKHYAVPIDTHPFVMYYNKKLLKEAGLLGEDGKPVFDNTADGFVQLLTALKEKLPKNAMPLALPSANDDVFRLWWALYHQLGGNDVISDDLKSAALDSGKAVQAMQYVQDLFHKHKVIRLNDPDFVKSFQSGTAAIIMTGVWTTGVWESTKGLEFGAMPIPKIFDKEATWGDSHTVILPVTKKEDPEKRKAAAIFADYLAQKGALWAKAGHIPAKPAIFDSAEFKALPYRSDYVSVASTVAFNKPSEKNWQIRDLAMFKFLNEVWANKMSPDDAAVKIQAEIDKVLKQ